MATLIHSGIKDLINILDKVRNNTTSAQKQKKLQGVINDLDKLWKNVINTQLNSSTAAYKDAMESLNDACAVAQSAVKDINRVSEAIQSVTTVTKVIDKLLKTASKLM